MGSFSITSNVNQLIISYQSGILGDDEVNLMTFINPSLEVKNGLFKFFENGIYKKTIPFKDLGDIVDSPASDIEDATDRINHLISGFSISPYKLISTSSTNANVVKASAGSLYSILAIGLTSTVRYLKLYNKATAPTVGTDIPVMTIPIPANIQGAGISIPFSVGVNFPLGIALAITTGSADNDNVAVVAGDVIINLTYA